MNIRSRLAELERKLGDSGELTLWMPDGTQHVIPLRRGRNMAHLFAKCMHDENCTEANLIRRAVKAEEPGHGLMWQVISALLNGPAETNRILEESE